MKSSHKAKILHGFIIGFFSVLTLLVMHRFFKAPKDSYQLSFFAALLPIMAFLVAAAIGTYPFSPSQKIPQHE